MRKRKLQKPTVRCKTDLYSARTCFWTRKAMAHTHDRHLDEWAELIGCELPDDVCDPEEERD